MLDSWVSRVTCGSVVKPQAPRSTGSRSPCLQKGFSATLCPSHRMREEEPSWSDIATRQARAVPSTAATSFPTTLAALALVSEEPGSPILGHGGRAAQETVACTTAMLRFPAPLLLQAAPCLELPRLQLHQVWSFSGSSKFQRGLLEWKSTI